MAWTQEQIMKIAQFKHQYQFDTLEKIVNAYNSKVHVKHYKQYINMHDSNEQKQNMNNQSMASSIHQCTLNDLISIITKDPLFNDVIINPFKNTIINYLSDNKIDGQILLKIKRKEFAEGLIVYNDSNTKIRGAANKCWTRLINYKPHQRY